MKDRDYSVAPGCVGYTEKVVKNLKNTVKGKVMFYKSIMYALVSILVALPVYAEEPAPAATTDVTGKQMAEPNPLEERIRAYRESFERRAAAQSGQQSEEMRKHHEAMEAKRAQYMEAVRKQREERAAQWREAMRNYRDVQLNVWLRRQEDRQTRAAARHEALRNKAEEEHNYLVQHHEEMLDQMLRERVDFANRQEKIRKQADNRRKKLAVIRATVKDMTPEERWAYMEEHRADLFTESAGMHGRSAPPMHPHRAPARPVPPPAE